MSFISPQDLLLDVLGSSATKRDAKAYLSRFKPRSDTSEPSSSQQKYLANVGVNLGDLYMPIRSVDQNPVFSQRERKERFQDAVSESMHVALVVLRKPQSVDDETLHGIGHTLVQLSRLGMSSVLVLDPCDDGDGEISSRINRAKVQADRVVGAIDSSKSYTARRVDGIVNESKTETWDQSTGRSEQVAKIVHRDLLISPLRKGMVPVIVPIAFSTDSQVSQPISADEVALALTRDLAGLRTAPSLDKNPHGTANSVKRLQKQISLDRIIVLDNLGPTPAPERPNGSHIFINLEQEYQSIQQQLHDTMSNSSGDAHARNLELFKETLALLPSSSSGLLTTPEAVAHSERVPPQSSQGPRVQTRRKRNPLIHNLLTDKPAFSSSLPSARSPSNLTQKSNLITNTHASALIKRGMPVTVIPDPLTHPWKPPSPSSSSLSLSDPRIDLPRLVHLIEDSFNRKFDLRHYLSRIENRIAGIIIAGSYEGGALFTWETPPAPSPSLDNEHRPAVQQQEEQQPSVPYLDKFAVLRRSQGAGSVADIVFSTMVRDCFPQGVCWRSRKDNPVNKWYFERAKGTWKIPDTGWTMFWTTEGVEIPGSGSMAEKERKMEGEGVKEGSSLFEDYEAVCRGVVPSWGDGKGALD